VSLKGEGQYSSKMLCEKVLPFGLGFNLKALYITALSRRSRFVTPQDFTSRLSARTHR